MALRPADGVNLPPGSQTAPVESITLFGPKQHASKGNRAGGRKAAAGAADAPHGGAGGVGVDGFDIDVDEYWEQDVLLGRDGGLAGFELGAGFDLGLSAPSGSGPMSQVRVALSVQATLSAWMRGGFASHVHNRGSNASMPQHARSLTLGLTNWACKGTLQTTGLYFIAVLFQRRKGTAAHTVS